MFTKNSLNINFVILRTIRGGVNIITKNMTKIKKIFNLIQEAKNNVA